MAYIAPSEIETLLYMSESAQLDFKRAQYPFSNVDAALQSEVLKDILAFANAWKTSEAFIVIGVEDAHAGRRKVLGVSEHLDDHSLQQFVSSKTNARVSFAYIATEVDGLPIGIIRIEKDQERPLYVRKTFGRVEADRVYIRRGSSTVFADPSEIAKMGEARVTQAAKPSLRLRLGRPKEGLLLDPVELESFVLVDPPRNPAREQLLRLASFKVLAFDPSPEKVAEYRRTKALLSEVAFVVENIGGVLLSDVRLVVTMPNLEGLAVRDAEPREPKLPFDEPITSMMHLSSTEVVATNEHCIAVSARVRKVQPGTPGWTESFWIGSTKTQTVPIRCRVSADNLSPPVDVTIDLQIVAREKAAEPDVSDEEIGRAIEDADTADEDDPFS